MTQREQVRELLLDFIVRAYFEYRYTQYLDAFRLLCQLQRGSE